MHCCGGMFPNALGFDISRLRSGEEIIIFVGEGDPKTDRNIVDTIWLVSGFSALTAKGYTISCRTITKLVRTGNFHSHFAVSDAALKIHRDALKAREEYEARFGGDDLPLEDFFGGDWDKLPPEPE